MYLSLRVSQGDESTREKEFTSWLCVRSLFSTWVRIGDFVLSFYTQNQDRGHTENYRYRVGHFSKMTRLPVRFRNCPVVFLLSRPVNKYEVKVHESVGLQERLSLCTCFSLCARSLPSSQSFPCPQSLSAMSRKKKSQKFGTRVGMKKTVPKKVLKGTASATSSSLVLAFQRQTANARAAHQTYPYSSFLIQ